jgi:YD repeat-containing protein
MTPPAVVRCVCGRDIIHTPRSKTLDAQPDLLGVHNADGTWQTAHDKARKIPGHHTHQCEGPRDTQEALFT